MFPLFLDLFGRFAVVVGGGAVGRRRAAALLDAGATVLIVCLEPQPADFWRANLIWETARYSPDYLGNADLVFAAATPKVNRRVIADARTLGVWVNSATESERADFIVPAIVRRGDFVVAVSTGGAAPAVAKMVRERLDAEFDDAFGAWVAILDELRPQVLVQDRKHGRRAWRRLCRWEWLDRLRVEGVEAVRRAMRADARLGDV